MFGGLPLTDGMLPGGEGIMLTLWSDLIWFLFFLQHAMCFSAAVWTPMHCAKFGLSAISTRRENWIGWSPCLCVCVNLCLKCILQRGVYFGDVFDSSHEKGRQNSHCVASVADSSVEKMKPNEAKESFFSKRTCSRRSLYRSLSKPFVEMGFVFFSLSTHCRTQFLTFPFIGTMQFLTNSAGVLAFANKGCSAIFQMFGREEASNVRH